LWAANQDLQREELPEPERWAANQQVQHDQYALPGEGIYESPEWQAAHPGQLPSMQPVGTFPPQQQQDFVPLPPAAPSNIGQSLQNTLHEFDQRAQALIDQIPADRTAERASMQQYLSNLTTQQKMDILEGRTSGRDILHSSLGTVMGIDKATIAEQMGKLGPEQYGAIEREARAPIPSAEARNAYEQARQAYTEQAMPAPQGGYPPMAAPGTYPATPQMQPWLPPPSMAPVGTYPTAAPAISQALSTPAAVITTAAGSVALSVEQVVQSIMGGDTGGTIAAQQLAQRAADGDPIAMLQLQLIRKRLQDEGLAA
jgi:hypothetical protein